jgi:hypothetical protein
LAVSVFHAIPLSLSLSLSFSLSLAPFLSRYYLNRLWEENRASLLKYIQEVHRGIKGIVQDVRGKPMANATVVVLNPDGQSRGKNMTASAQGEYWRILLPGKYRYKFTYSEQCLCRDFETLFVSENRQMCSNICRTYLNIKNISRMFIFSIQSLLAISIYKIIIKVLAFQRCRN